MMNRNCKGDLDVAHLLVYYIMMETIKYSVRHKPLQYQPELLASDFGCLSGLKWIFYLTKTVRWRSLKCGRGQALSNGQIDRKSVTPLCGWNRYPAPLHPDLHISEPLSPIKGVDSADALRTFNIICTCALLLFYVSIRSI